MARRASDAGAACGYCVTKATCAPPPTLRRGKPVEAGASRSTRLGKGPPRRTRRARGAGVVIEAPDGADIRDLGKPKHYGTWAQFSKFTISTIDAIGQKADAARKFRCGGSLSLKRKSRDRTNRSILTPMNSEVTLHLGNLWAVATLLCSQFRFMSASGAWLTPIDRPETIRARPLS